LARGNNYPDADGGACDDFCHSDIYRQPMPENGVCCAGGVVAARVEDHRSAGPETSRVQCAPIVNPIRRQITGRSFMWSPDVTQEHSLGGQSCARRGCLQPAASTNLPLGVPTFRTPSKDWSKPLISGSHTLPISNYRVTRPETHPY
jgi:hypothetical protein